ncbi:hypothetical protein CH63R_09169 [Colletotrichum higginsianum IMI 349063]|uniref:Uncharacterized protein n=1 Tax=Colletotrichum higginsianum (strain IMI 349063) TaxID=759273 RepID=A0A1B7Y6N9_COLHI|nr:hypothetical protein CH63R_09169 [Colletotrichum higginsianum IMI 349063]OBR07648.1 hypothetical protein CH63R_09169 [Colletotrichum higginsianum IMI 349063]
MSPNVWLKSPMATNWRIWTMTFTSIGMTHSRAPELTTDHATPSHVKERPRARERETAIGNNPAWCQTFALDRHTSEAGNGKGTQ